MTDAAFDALALASDPTITTGRHDQWWRETFKPHTGQWIHHHPELDGIARIFQLTTTITHATG